MRGSSPIGANLSCLASSACAGLTRASIFFARKFLRRSVDCRAKPGHDDQRSRGVSRNIPAPADFVDDNAVVELAFAVAHAGLEHVLMHLQGRQPLLHALRLLQYEMHILEMLGDASFGSKFAAHHPRTLYI